MTTAERIARELDDNGTRFDTDDGRNLSDLARAEGARAERGTGDKHEATRFTFPDGSAVVAYPWAWDVAFPGCWCWEGGRHEETACVPA